jgi:hypothetical protein
LPTDHANPSIATLQPSKAADQARKANSRAQMQKWLGIAAIGLALLLAGVFVVQTSVLAPPSPEEVKADIQIAHPEQVSGVNSRINGLDRNQRPYEIRAKSGIQDKTIETLVHLQNVEGDFERSNGSKLDVVATGAQFDTKTRDLLLEGKVVFSEGQRFVARMSKASVNMENQVLASQSPVEVNLQGAVIKADSLQVLDNGNRILFRGGVKARFVTKSK